ncbi:MAG TPA: IPT/TIG domain-containing protein [Candidatus Dormibacteraeota bacterium]|nr:IPT/TIG domain-containing protein [Candidatus Dormibacteraeota bacterium]
MPNPLEAGPRIENVSPVAAIPGGDIFIRGNGFESSNSTLPSVRFGQAQGNILLWSEQLVVARVPEDAEAGVSIETGHGRSDTVAFALGRVVAENLHPVANPAIDSDGNTYVTFSGQRGQKVAVPLYKISPDFTVKPLAVQLTNPTGLAFDPEGNLMVSCRNDGTIHRIGPDGHIEKWIEGMGIATGLAFDREGNLYVGDRSGTIFKISPQREILVFATLEPSISAYHLAFSPEGDLYVTGPTTSSFDRIHRISHAGAVSVFFRGLGRPQGMAFDRSGNLLVVASLGGRRGVVRLSPDGRATLLLTGYGLVGMALLSRRAILASNSSLYSIEWDIDGLPLGR